MLSTEDLLKPRYKVIADYPGNELELNEILFVDEYGHSLYYNDSGRVRIHLLSYPHLFKKLEWWEERKESDMPQYVKDTTENAVFKPFELKKQWGGRSGMWSGISPDDETDCHWKKNCVPATLEEYLNQPK